MFYFKSPTFIVVRTIEIASLSSLSIMFMMWYKIFLILLSCIKKMCLHERSDCGHNNVLWSPVMTSDEFIAVNILLGLLCIS